jgi:multidrug resistance efflux pump
MSKTCGDTARFNRLRKQKIARRQNVRELRAAIDAAKAAKAPKPVAA